MIFRILEDQHAEKARAAKAADRRFMQLALAMGRRGLGRTSPNPAVGAVVVKDGIVVGRGWTQDGGRPHAEPEALRRAGASAKGATLYVTLEPCSHHGHSPPCADAVIAAGIARVVSAMDDPNPKVAGQGHARLRAAGIVVNVGLCADEAARDHAGHISRVTRQRPHAILKLAVSSDQKIGVAGKSVAITGEQARSRMHLLRAQCDAILVGIGTVLSDNPDLTCRLPGMGEQSPVRVVLDRSLRISGDSRLVHSARATPLWIICEETAEAMAATRLSAAGAVVIRLPEDPLMPAQAGLQNSSGSPLSRGRADVSPPPLDLGTVLAELNGRGITRLMVEGGARVAESFLKAGYVDEVWLLRGPDAIGEGGIAALHATRLSAITQSSAFRVRGSETLGHDTLTIYERN